MFLFVAPAVYPAEERVFATFQFLLSGVIQLLTSEVLNATGELPKALPLKDTLATTPGHA
jgi:hypothetical protein